MKTDFLYQFYYLWSVVLVIPLWTIILYRNKNSRVEIIYMGILFGTSAMGLDKYCSFYDYWRPPTLLDSINFESFLYGFFWGGISTKIYEFIVNKENSPKKDPNWIFVLTIVFSSFILYMLILGLFDVNSVDIYMGLLLMWVILFLLFRRNLYRASLLSGLIMVVLNVGWYAVILAIYPAAIEKIWFTKQLSGVTLLKVPIEEHLYIFSLGCFGSVMYKVATSFNRSKMNEVPVYESNTGRAGALLKPYRVPGMILLLVIGRIAVFGDTRIPVGKFFRAFILPLFSRIYP